MIHNYKLFYRTLGPLTTQNFSNLIDIGFSLVQVKVLVSGAFQGDLRDPKCWHNSNMRLRFAFFIEKNFQIFFSFWDTLHIFKWQKVLQIFFKYFLDASQARILSILRVKTRIYFGIPIKQIAHNFVTVVLVF